LRDDQSAAGALASDRARSPRAAIARLSSVLQICSASAAQSPERCLRGRRHRSRRLTLADWVGACAATLMPIVEAIRAHAFAAEHIHADDTPVKVLAKPNAARDDCGS